MYSNKFHNKLYNNNKFKTLKKAKTFIINLQYNLYNLLNNNINNMYSSKIHNKLYNNNKSKTFN